MVKRFGNKDFFRYICSKGKHYEERQRENNHRLFEGHTA